MLVTTANGYRVISGGYNADFLQITLLGERIVDSRNEFEKRKAIYDTLFANEIFKAFVERFRDKALLADQVLIDYLQQTHKLSHEDAKACWSVFKENIEDFGLLQEYSGKRILVTAETALEKMPKPDNYSPEPEKIPEIPSTPIGNLSVPSRSEAEQPKKTKDLVQPQFNFNIQIHLPENASPEVYEAIFKNISIHLLNREED